MSPFLGCKINNHQVHNNFQSPITHVHLHLSHQLYTNTHTIHYNHECIITCDLRLWNTQTILVVLSYFKTMFKYIKTHTIIVLNKMALSKHVEKASAIGFLDISYKLFCFVNHKLMYYFNHITYIIFNLTNSL
jgi:hypothetical protein